MNLSRFLAGIVCALCVLVAARPAAAAPEEDETRWVCDAAWLAAVYGQVVVPLCLPEGASGIAPPALREADSGTLEQVASVTQLLLLTDRLSGAARYQLERGEPLPERQPPPDLPATPDGLCPAAPELPLRLLPMTPLARAGRDDTEAPGFAARVYRPPRG